LLRPALESVQLDVGGVLYAPGQPVRHVYLVETGLVSIVGANKGRRRMEVGMVEGMTSVETVLGGGVAAHEALVQSPGSALRLSSAALRDAIGQSRSLEEMLLRFAHVFMIQAAMRQSPPAAAASTSVSPVAC